MLPPLTWPPLNVGVLRMTAYHRDSENGRGAMLGVLVPSRGDHGAAMGSIIPQGGGRSRSLIEAVIPSGCASDGSAQQKC